MTEEPTNSEPDLSVLRMERPEERDGPSRGGGGRARRVGYIVAAAALLATFGLAFLPRLSWFLPEVEVATVRLITPEEASSVLTATGYTYARERAAVGTKIIGRVERLLVDEGDRVRAGDTIAVLDSDDLLAAVRQRRAVLLEARATVADARRQEARLARLLEENAIAQAEYDAEATRLEVAEAQVAVAEANLATARARLGYAVITAPIPGVIIERMIEVGEMVAPGGLTTQRATGAMVRIANPESLEVEADINEAYISRLSPGQPAVIRVDAVPGREYRGRLRQIVPTADRQRAVVEVKVTVEDRDERLLPDMSCSVTFLEAGEEVAAIGAGEARLVVSVDAVREGPEGSFVYRIVDGRLRLTRVQLGAEEDGDVIVQAGLNEGDVVARSDAGGLEDGSRVRVR